MDIFKYLNSKDIAEYLRSIDYKFTSAEAAWIIWHCRSITLAEKYEAWQEIIDTMPDCTVMLRGSLHNYLKELMAQQYDGTESLCEFDNWWFLVPTPFKTGDIVIGGLYDEPFVFEKLDEYFANMYEIDENGEVCCYPVVENIDLEYYHGELTGKQKVLEKLSTYLSIADDLTCY